MIIYNNNIITSGAYWNDEYADSWCHEDCYATSGIVPVVNKRQVREGNWVVVDTVVQNISAPASGGTYTYNLGVTAPFYTFTSNSWLVGTARIYSRNGTVFVSRGSAVTASDLLESASLGEDGGIVGAHYEVVKYFPIRVSVTVPRNTGAERFGQIRFRNERGDLNFYHLATGNIYTVFSINVNQQAGSTTSNYGSLKVTGYQDLSSSMPVFTYRVFTINVGSIKNLTLDTRSTSIPHTFDGIQSGSYNITITGFGITSMGQRYKLSCTSSPSTVTIPANGSDSITIRVNSASLSL